MALSFPTLGPPDSFGQQGMYIGERHDDAATMTKLLEEWPTISGQIDTLFLEYFGAGMVPPESNKAIRELWRDNMNTPTYVWDYEDLPVYRSRKWVPASYAMLMRLAKSSGTVVKGVDNWPLVSFTQMAPGPRREEAKAFRTGDLLHEMWTQCVRLSARGTRYAIYGGGAHAVYLRRRWLPNLVSYALDTTTNTFREYSTIAGGRFVFAP